jgi:hypothetical protein
VFGNQCLGHFALPCPRRPPCPPAAILPALIRSSSFSAGSPACRALTAQTPNRLNPALLRRCEETETHAAGTEPGPPEYPENGLFLLHGGTTSVSSVDYFTTSEALRCS